MEKYRFEVPEGISAIDEIILRFCGLDSMKRVANLSNPVWEGLFPISCLLIKAGYSQYAVQTDLPVNLQLLHDIIIKRKYPTIKRKGPTIKDPISEKNEWADIHSEDWRRYHFDRWEDFKKEISEEIKRCKNDDIQLRSFIYKLLLPFRDFYFYNEIHFNNREKSSHEAIILVSEYSNQSHFSIDEFIPLWKTAVEKANEDFNPLIEDSLIIYEKALRDYIKEEMFKEWRSEESEVAKAYYYRSEIFPTQYASCIAGCLLTNHTQHNYMDYQNECDVHLVDELSVADVAMSIDWPQKQLVQLCNSNWLVGSEDYLESPESPECITADEETANEKDCNQEELGTVSFGGDITKLPKELQSKKAAEIWDKAFDMGLIDKDFNFIGTRVEQGLFAGAFANFLFGNKRNWYIWEKWAEYSYVRQKHNNAFGKAQFNERGLMILGLFK